MHNQARVNLLNRFESDQLAKEDLVVLAIPISFPYPIDSREFEHGDEAFEFAGQHYRLVERRFENDTIFLVCVKDAESTRISQRFIEYVSISNDLPSGRQRALSFLSKVFKDYTPPVEITSPHYISESLELHRYPFSENWLPLISGSVESPPPELLF